jgi:hypothetical protein
MNSFWSVVFALGLLVSFTSVAQTQQRKGAGRNHAPLFDLTPTITTEEQKAREGIVRSYLWHFWRAGAHVLFRVRTYTREGDPTTCTYLVESHESGVGRVAVTCKESVCPFTSKAKCREYLRPRVSTYDAVERKVPGENGERIPVDKRVISLEYVLKLTNSVTGVSIQL